MEKEVEISGRTFKIKELTIDEGLNFKPNSDAKQSTFDFVLTCIVSPIITIDEFKAMPFRDGLKLITAINELNGLTQDFTKSMTTTATN